MSCILITETLKAKIMKTIVSVITFLLLTSMGPATQVVIRGRVTGPNDLPLKGVTVMVRGTSTSTATNINGDYAITPGPAAKVLVFSLQGMKNLEELSCPEIRLQVNTVF